MINQGMARVGSNVSGAACIWGARRCLLRLGLLTDALLVNARTKTRRDNYVTGEVQRRGSAK